MLARFEKLLVVSELPKAVRRSFVENGQRILAGLRNTLFPGLLLLLLLTQAAHGSEHQVARVFDGDTIKVNGDSGELTIRLVGIDAPERSKRKGGLGQTFSQQATKYLSGLVLNKPVDVKESLLERYGRILGIVTLEGTDKGIDVIALSDPLGVSGPRIRPR